MTMFKTCVFIGVLSLTAAICPAFALDSAPLRVNVPFSFLFAGETLPAGSYIVAASGTSGVVTITGAGLGYMALSGPSGPYNPDSQPGLIFQKEADGQHLVSVTLSGEAPRLIPGRPTYRVKIAALAAAAK